MRRENSKKFSRDYATLATATKLLEDRNLEWSSDFEVVREDLAKFLRYETPNGNLANRFALDIAKSLTDEEFDITT